MPDRWLSNEDWEAVRRLKERNDHLWLELGDAPALTDELVAEMRAIQEEWSRILGRCAARRHRARRVECQPARDVVLGLSVSVRS